MSITKKSILFFLWLLLSFSALYAAPAYPDPVRMKQPDGKELSLFIHGDEKIRWMESPDGYTLLYNEDKFIVYAIQNDEGDIIPSPIIAQEYQLRSSEQNKQLENIPKKLFYSEKQIQLFKEIWEMKDSALKSSSKSDNLRATTGTAYAICALMEFPDKPMTKTKDDFELLFNQIGYNLHGAVGSVRDLYYENSYGQLELIVDIVGPFVAENEMSYYGGNSGGRDKNPGVLAREAARAAFANLTADEVKRYDNDEDGFIDTFHFLYAGYGEESGGDASTIWAHKSSMTTQTFAGYKLNTYSCSPELRLNYGDNITHIGVICHELGHVFGAPDFYDANGSSGGEYLGTGDWDLMSTGCWNGSREHRGAFPAHINMYQKINFGWVEPETLNSSRFIDGMPNSIENPVAYRYDTQTSGEYFVLENRQRRGLDYYSPGTGLLIYRVSIRQQDISGNSVNRTHPQRVYPVCASVTNYSLPIANVSSYGNIDSAGCPFPGSSNQTEFTDYSFPAAIAWNETETKKPITEIAEKNGLISFHFMKSSSVTNLTSEIEYLNEGEARISLSWDPPTSDSPIVEYKIYRNNIFRQSTNQTKYRDTVNENGTYIYQITVVYETYESDASTIEVDIKLTSLEEISFGQFTENAEFYFYSLQGKLIVGNKSKDFLFSASSELKPGVYILQVRDQNKISNYKWIIR